MLTEVYLLVVLVAIIALELPAPVLHTTDGQAVVLIDVSAGAAIDIVPDIGVDVLPGVDASVWAAKTTAFKFISMLASSEEALLFCLGARLCCATAVWVCRSLHARMPSDQV